MRLFALLAVLLLATTASRAADPLASPGWPNIAEEFFAGGEILFDDQVSLIMPSRVENPHDVPISVRLSPELGAVREILVVAENNPIRQVARLFPHRPISALSFKIRLESTTPVRAAALTEDGVWHVGSAHADVLTPGGCSVPGNRGADVADALVGDIAFRTFARDDGSARLKFRIIHPMETGFAVGADGELIPAHFVETITIGDDAGPVVAIETEAAMAADPIITIDVPELRQSLRITARDNEGLDFDSGAADAPSM